MKLLKFALVLSSFMTAVYSESFFDYSDEDGMIRRFRSFDGRKIIPIKKLEMYGVFDRAVAQENLPQATQVAKDLWSCILQESMPNSVDFSCEDEKRLRQKFWEFRAYYQEKFKWEDIKPDVRKYLILFSRIEGILYIEDK